MISQFTLHYKVVEANVTLGGYENVFVEYGVSVGNE